MSVFPPKTIFIKLLKDKRDKDGDAVIVYPRSAEKSFWKKLFAPSIRNVQLDKLGTKVWDLCDGKTDFQSIINIVKEAFPDEQNIKTRVELFLHFLVKKNMVKAMIPSSDATE